MKISKFTRQFTASVIGTFIASAPLFGSIYFYEDFDYQVGSTLDGKAGGTGFATGSSWTMKAGTGSSAVISDVALSYNLGGTILTANQSVNITGTSSTVKDFAYYKFDTTYNTDEFYVSFLVSSSEWTAVGGQIGIALANATTAANYQTVTASAHATNGTRWQTNVGAGSQAVVSAGNELNETHLIVVRFYKDGTTYFNKSSLWIDPTSSIQGAPDATANVGTGRISSFLYLNILNYSSGTADFNIGRLVGGSSWNDVIMPIPEPGSVMLLVGGAGVCLFSLRNRLRKRQTTSTDQCNLS